MTLLWIISQVPTDAVPTSSGGFNWADYGPLGVMAFGLLSAVVVLWRKNERLEAESKAQAERVLTVLIEVNRILPDVLTSIRDMRQDRNNTAPALERVVTKMDDLDKSIRSLIKATGAKRRAKS